MTTRNKINVDNILNILGESKDSLPNFYHILNRDFYIEILESMYSRNRGYHTLEHINNLFIELSTLIKEKGLKVEKLDELCIAILFHDIFQYTICDVVNSKILAHTLLSMDKIIKSLDLDKICYLIDATDHNRDYPLDEEQKLIHDLDLSILCKGRKKYKKYCSQVYSELIDNGFYHYVNPRIEFLKDMLNRGKIYLTEYFDEEKARKNLQYELDELSN